MSELDKSEFFSVDAAAGVRSQSFAPAEMVTCESCLRANPPTRADCLYCGERLPATKPFEPSHAATEAVLAPPSRGFYVVISVARNEPLDESIWQQIATRTPLKLTDLKSGLRTGGSLPLLQVSTSREAYESIDGFRALGIQASLVKSDDLGTGSANKKIRALEFSDAGLAGLVRTSAERLFQKWDDLTLLVVGRLQTNDVEEVVRRKRGENKPVERRELTNDESIFDLYSRSAGEGWRIVADSFDFSCLGQKKGITAFENFRALVKLLSERAENLEVNESYLAVRPLLTNLWPLEASTRTGGWRRSGAGKFDLSTVTTTDNENQFTNYSRLLHCLKRQEVQRQTVEG